jgi:hypothetical protein
MIVHSLRSSLIFRMPPEHDQPGEYVTPSGILIRS